MATLVTTIHFIVCILLIISVLLQAGKGADIGAAFGAGASQAMFGPRSAATVLSKITAGLAIVFFTTSIYLAHHSRKMVNPDSVINKATVLETAPVEKVEPVEKTDQTGETKK